MAARLVVGTIRMLQGERHVVALPDGRTMSLTFEGGEAPLIGGDVVALVDPDDAEARIRLVPDVTRLILSHGARIAVGAPTAMTATMLAIATRGTGIGGIAPGTGGVIERTPDSGDPDLSWAIRFLGKEALDIGLGLNVLDPLALARAPWDSESLRNERLPADAVGERGALDDLRRLMAEGFTPACRRTLFGPSRGPKVPSVDFILPFSPFATGQSHSAAMAGASRPEVARDPLTGSEARRFSAFREIAKAFAPRYLGKVRTTGSASAHIEEAFADAAAAIALANANPGTSAIRKIAHLRETALARATGMADARTPATYGVLATVMSLAGYLRADDAATLLQTAASIARAHAPRNDDALAKLQAEATERDTLLDLEKASPAERRAVADAYRLDCEDVAVRLEQDPRALDRMSRFGAVNVPMGLEHVFDQVLEDSGAPAFEMDGDEIGISLGPDPWAMP